MGVYRHIVFAVMTLLLTVAASQSARAQFLHPKIQSKETKIRNVVILPAKVNVVRDSMKGPEGMAAESDELSQRVEKIIAEVLEKQKQVAALPTSGATSTSTDGGS